MADSPGCCQEPKKRFCGLDVVIGKRFCEHHLMEARGKQNFIIDAIVPTIHCQWNVWGFCQRKIQYPGKYCWYHKLNH